jgi:putative ABC transport system substrate-binding protein
MDRREHFVTEPRGGEGKPERFPNVVAELVRLQVDMIVAPWPILPPVKQATATIPVVMTGIGDPVAQGFVQASGVEAAVVRGSIRWASTSR